MTQDPNQPPTTPVTPNYVTPPQGRTAIPKVLGIIGIVYGVLSILLALWSFVGLTIWGIVGGLVGLALAGLLIFASVQLMNYKRKGAALTRIWAFAMLVFAVIGLVAGAFTILGVDAAEAVARMTEEQRAEVEESGLSAEAAVTAGKSVLVGGLICFTLFRLVLPILDLILLSRQNVKDALVE